MSKNSKAATNGPASLNGGARYQDDKVRVAILATGLLLADLGLLAPSVYVLAALGTVTVLQRIFHVRAALRAERAA